MLFINWHWITMISISTNGITKEAISIDFRHLDENFRRKRFLEPFILSDITPISKVGLTKADSSGFLNLCEWHCYEKGLKAKIFTWIIIHNQKISFGNTLSFWKPQVKIDILRGKYPFTVNGHVLLNISQCC